MPTRPGTEWVAGPFVTLEMVMRELEVLRRHGLVPMDGPRPRAADDYDVIRARLEEIKRDQRNSTTAVADPYCFQCGAADAQAARSGQCTGACSKD